MSKKNRGHVWILQGRFEGAPCNCRKHRCLSDWKLVGVFATAAAAKAKQKGLAKEYRTLGERIQFSAVWTPL